MICKAEPAPTAIGAIRNHTNAHLMPVGGSAYLMSKTTKESHIVAFEAWE